MAPGDALAQADRRIRDLAARLGEDLDWERLPATCPVCPSMDWQSSETDESRAPDASNPA